MPIDIGSQIDMYTLAPACGMDINFRTIILDADGIPGEFRAVNCDDNRTCYVEKCNGGASTIGDDDCDNLPYDMNFTVIVQAYLEDGTIDESISFPIEILDPCRADTLEFAPGIQNFQYDLKTPAIEADRTPTITQLNPGLCPVECELRDASAN